MFPSLVAHDCGYPLSRYTCRATRVAADFLDFIAFCRCSTGVALHPLKISVSHLPPPCAGRCRTEIWVSEKVSRYTGVSQLQLRVSRYTVQLSSQEHSQDPKPQVPGTCVQPARGHGGRGVGNCPGDLWTTKEFHWTTRSMCHVSLAMLAHSVRLARFQTPTISRPIC